VDPIPGFVPITLSGHRSSVVAGHFSESGDTIYSVSKDGAVFTWVWTQRPTLPAALLGTVAEKDADSGSEDSEGSGDDAVPAAGAGSGAKKGRAAAAIARRNRFQPVPDPTTGASPDSYSVLSGEWRLTNKHFFKQDNAKVGVWVRVWVCGCVDACVSLWVRVPPAACKAPGVEVAFCTCDPAPPVLPLPLVRCTPPPFTSAAAP
jgi:hypothetical protein